MGGGTKPREGGAAKHPPFIYSGSLTVVYPRDSENELATSDVTPTECLINLVFLPELLLHSLLNLTEQVDAAISAFASDSVGPGFEFRPVVRLY